MNLQNEIRQVSGQHKAHIKHNPDSRYSEQIKELSGIMVSLYRKGVVHQGSCRQMANTIEVAFKFIENYPKISKYRNRSAI